jgi:hypothetical protein
MKIMAFLVTCIAAFCATAYMSFDTDPFQTRNALHGLTEMAPSVAYADSTLLIAGDTASTMTWEKSNVSSYKSVMSVVESDIDALCESPSKEFREHPRYDEIC